MVKNNVLNNKNGNVLIYALGVITVLIVLTASLTNLTMTRTLWSSKNAYRIKQVSAAKMAVDAAASELTNEFEIFNQSGNSDYRYLYELIYTKDSNGYYSDGYFKNIFNSVESTYNVKIRDLTTESCAYPNVETNPACYPNITKETSYTLAYEIVYDDGHVVAQKKLFLSMIPSFLYFALGSKSDITINGGAYVEGDIYTENNLFLSNVTNYTLKDVLNTEMTSYLTVNPNNSVYIQNKLYSCKESGMTTCYDKNTDPYRFNPNLNSFNPITFYSTTFTNTPPKIKHYSDRFLDVNFDASYVYYINDALGNPFTSNYNENIDINNLGAVFDEYIMYNAITPITDPSQIDPNSTKSYIVRDETIPTFTITNDIELNKDRWLIIDGNLDIESYSTISVIDANILVTGDVTIKGNVDFSSTIYALGKGNIVNASIRGFGTNQLVLLTKDDIEFKLLNAFDNRELTTRFSYDPITEATKIDPHIKGFFYTDSNAQIFTTASYIVLEGGIFTNDSKNSALPYPIDKDNYVKYTTFDYVDNAFSIGLSINSYRGEVRDKIDYFSFIESNKMEQSRLVIKHDIGVIKEQPKGLPLNSQINYIFEDVTVK